MQMIKYIILVVLLCLSCEELDRTEMRKDDACEIVTELLKTVNTVMTLEIPPPPPYHSKTTDYYSFNRIDTFVLYLDKDKSPKVENSLFLEDYLKGKGDEIQLDYSTDSEVIVGCMKNGTKEYLIFRSNGNNNLPPGKGKGHWQKVYIHVSKISVKGDYALVELKWELNRNTNASYEVLLFKKNNDFWRVIKYRQMTFG